MWVLPAMRRDSVHCPTALTDKFAGVARRWCILAKLGSVGESTQEKQAKGAGRPPNGWVRGPGLLVN